MNPRSHIPEGRSAGGRLRASTASGDADRPPALERLVQLIAAEVQDEGTRAEAMALARALASSPTPTSVDVWLDRYAPGFTPSRRQRDMLELFIANGSEGVGREALAAVLGKNGQPATRSVVRRAVCDLRYSLERAGSRVVIPDATTRDGIYRTHEPVVQPMPKVLRETSHFDGGGRLG